jgi:hypothetical protein
MKLSSLSHFFTLTALTGSPAKPRKKKQKRFQSFPHFIIILDRESHHVIIIVGLRIYFKICICHAGLLTSSATFGGTKISGLPVAGVK